MGYLYCQMRGAVGAPLHTSAALGSLRGASFLALYGPVVMKRRGSSDNSRETLLVAL
jgi:hypothetical protein